MERSGLPAGLNFIPMYVEKPLAPAHRSILFYFQVSFSKTPTWHDVEIGGNMIRSNEINKLNAIVFTL